MTEGTPTDQPEMSNVSTSDTEHLTPNTQPATPDTSLLLAQVRRRNRIILMCAIAGAFGAFFLILPMLYRAHYDYLLWSEGFMERAFAKSFVSGHYEKLIEAPKPLWNMFWLLSEFPNRLYLFIAAMIGLVFLVYQLVSDKLTRSIVPGLVALLITVFGFKDVLGLFLEGSWMIPHMVLGMWFMLALLNKRWGWAAVAIGLAGLIRPESWLLAIFLLFYIWYSGEGRGSGVRDRKAGPGTRHAAPGNSALRWYYFLPLLAPFLWALYDHRVSGDWFYSFHNTAAYAILTGVPGTGFLSFWPRLVPDIADSTGIVLLVYAVVGIVARAINVAREAKKQKALAILFDPLFAVTLLPLIAAWLLSIQGDLIIMRRFFYLSISLLALYAILAGWELLRSRNVANRSLIAGVIALPLVLIGLVRLPGTLRDGQREVKVTEAKMAAVPELAQQLMAMTEMPPPSPANPNPRPALDNYKYILIPFRRYALFNAFTNESIARKFVSYRELSLAVTATQYRMMGEDVESPPHSPPLIQDLIQSGKVFADYLPALAVWIPDDEMHYIDAFSFDDPNYFHRNYIDKGHYAFRIIGSALDSLGLVYDVREVTQEQMQNMIPPGQQTPPDTQLGQEGRENQPNPGNVK